MKAQPPLAIAVSGGAGRMGRELVAAIRLEARLRLVGELGRDDATRSLVLRDAAVVIDFSSGAGAARLATELPASGGPALVIGSTGLTPAEDAALEDAATRVAVVRSGNFSLGVNLLLGLVAQAARALDAAAYDIEVSEAHHRRKRDAPSGTALMLGEAAAAARGVRLSDVMAPPRHGVGEVRREGAIGFSALRGGGIVGDHAVAFAAEDEILTLSHSARDRSLFARGAVAAALWVAARPPGLYDMQDVLGLKGALGAT